MSEGPLPEGTHRRDPPARFRKGTRVLRIRTRGRTPWQGQPGRPLTHPGIPHAGPEQHWCAECFGPRNRYAAGPFCSRCERELFAPHGYIRFLASERARQRYRRKRIADAT